MGSKYFNLRRLIKKNIYSKKQSKVLSFLMRVILLLTLTSLIICPHADLLAVTTDQDPQSKPISFTYDSIINMLNDIEDDDFEDRYSQSQIDEINHFLVLTAMSGISDDPNEKLEIE